MGAITYVWRRRWCRLIVTTVLVVGLACLHPFVRQALFGPRIDGIPWCMWENEIRVQADTQPREESWLYKTLAKLGLVGPPARGFIGDDPAALPVYLHLADDRNVDLRKLCLERLEPAAKKHPEVIVPVLRKRLQDDDPLCRVLAARGIWWATKDRAMKAVLLAALDPRLEQQDAMIGGYARDGLCGMAADIPELFEVMVTMSEDEQPRFAAGPSAMLTMHHFGKRGLPVIRKGLMSSCVPIQHAAVVAARRCGPAGAELIPDLLALQNDARAGLREDLASALHALDPRQFPDTEKSEK